MIRLGWFGRIEARSKPKEEQKLGLDVSHDAFHGAYSSFNRLRRFIAKSMGGSWPPHDDESLEINTWYWGDGYTPESHSGLFEFMNHSDCDGEISPEMCVKVADDLEALLPAIQNLAASADEFGHITRDGGYTEVTKRFIAGCRLAAAANEPLIFG